MRNIFSFFKKRDIGRPPWDYFLLQNLDEKDYPKYLAREFQLKTGEKLDMKKPKTFNQKIQWLKLNDVTDLKKFCTDKVTARSYVRKKIGEEYLKPMLQLCFSFEDIDFESLPESFIMKCSHGCKWHYVIKDKNEYLNNKSFIDITRRNMTGWLEQEFWCFNGFEMQYKGLEPKILIEPLMRDKINTNPREIEIYCFSGQPKIYVNVRYQNRREITFYNEDFSISDLVLHPDGRNIIINEEADDILKKAVKLSSELTKDFIFARADWLVYKNQLYFNELTFSPYSGFVAFDKDWELKLGSWIDIKKKK